MTALGLGHGLIFVPVVLSLVGPNAIIQSKDLPLHQETENSVETNDSREELTKDDGVRVEISGSEHIASDFLHQYLRQRQNEQPEHVIVIDPPVDDSPPDPPEEWAYR